MFAIVNEPEHDYRNAMSTSRNRIAARLKLNSKTLPIWISTPFGFLLTFVISLLFYPRLLPAQVATGDVLGGVTDVTGLIIPGASIRLENVGTHEVRSSTTNSAGEYVFSAFAAGHVSITVVSPSFRTFTETNVVVAATDRTRINAVLQPGTVDDRVEVTASPSSLQTDSTTAGNTITEKTLLDAPNNGRNYVALIQVQAGVNAGSAGSLSSGSAPTDRRLPSNVSANGQEELLNNNQVDGLDNNSRALGAPLLRPSVEAIAETRTDINLYRAEVGRIGGAAINVITKSGDNQIHVSMYEFFRNDITDARNFFAPASVIAHKLKLRRNQYGGSISGRVTRNKTFFFADYEGLRRSDGNNYVYISTVPTASEEANPGVICDPTLPAAATCINPLTGQTIPSVATASINPTTLGYFKLFPTPNLPGVSNNFIYNPAAILSQQLGDGRIDHHFGPNDTLFGRYSYNTTQAFTPPYLPNINEVAAGGSLAGAGPSNNGTVTHNGQFGYTHIFAPNLLLKLKAGYTYFNLASTSLNNGVNYNNSAPYLIPNANQCPTCTGLAPIQIAGYAALGDTLAIPVGDIEHVTQFAGVLSYTRGPAQSQVRQRSHRNFSYQLQLFPKGLSLFADASPQLALANFLRGNNYLSNRQALLNKLYDRLWEPSVYAQDDWRATDHLTFNFGLRYDVFTKANDKYGNYANFDLSSLTLIKNATGGIRNVYTELSPRIGFDATISPGTMLRGGFGLAFM